MLPREVAAAQGIKEASRQLACFVNLPGKPVVSVQLSNPVSVKAGEVLSARVLNHKELYDVLHAPRQMHVPLSFTEKKHMIFRGMHFDNLHAVKNLLESGLEVDATSNLGVIYASSRLATSLSYALPEGDVSFPVLTRIELTRQLRETNYPDHFKSRYVFHEDIPANAIPEVMLFLQMGEQQPGWYKAELQNGKVVLTDVPGVNVPLEK